MLDHLDEITLRTLTGRIVQRRSALYDQARVLSAPLLGRGAGWRVGDHREAHRRRRVTALAQLHERSCPGMGVTDTTNYFASVDPELLKRTLLQGGCSQGAVVATTDLLASLARLTGVGGLPIGAESSAFFGNVYLAPADGVFTTRGIPSLRWTDDVWAFPPSEHEWHEAVEEYDEALGRLGLETNKNKTTFLDREAAIRHVQNPTVDYMLTLSTTASLTAEAAADQLAQMLFFGWMGEPVDQTAARFCLGVLRSRQSPLGVPIVNAYPEFFDSEPTAVGNYLLTIAMDPTTRSHLDPEWLLGRASRAHTSGTVAAGVQSLRVLTQIHLSKSVGDRLLAIASAPDLAAAQVPLRQWAAYAWHRSDGWKANTAGSAAEDAGHLAVKRCFTAGLRRASSSRSAQLCLDHLLRQEPDLAPTVAWAR